MNILSSDDFRRELKKGLSGGYLFFGDEDYLKLSALNSARSAVCPEEAFAFFNDLRIDPLDLTADSLLDALAPLPMMSDAKIVSVSGLNVSSMKASDVDDLCDVFDNLSEYPSNVLIISIPSGGIDEGRLPKSPSAILTKLTKSLKPVCFGTPPQAKLIAWCEKHFEHNGVSCEDDVCRALFERCGTSMFTLAAEIDKLSFYALSHGKNKIEKEDIPLVTCSVLEEEAFALTNSLLDGKGSKALEALEVMKYNRIEPVIILSEISKTICDLILIKSMLSDGKTYVEIISAFKPLKVAEYTVKLRIAGANSKSMDKLKRALKLCSDADKQIKLSGGYAVIEQLLCSI